MIVHYSIFIFLIILIFALSKKTNRNYNIFYFIVFILFFILISFRKYDIGNDTSEYYRIFEMIKQKPTLFSVIGFTRYEIGYTVLNYLVAKIFGTFTALLCIEAGFYLFSILRFVRKYSDSPKFTILLLFTFLLFYDVMITARQCISVAIFLLAIDFLIKDKKINYILLILIAITFQKSSIVLLPICFLPKADITNLKEMVKWISLIVGILIVVNYLSVFLSFMDSNYLNYMVSDYSVGGIRIASIMVFLLRIFMIVIVCLFKRNENKNLNRKDIVLSQLMVLDCIVCGISLIFNLFDRLDSFFVIPYIVYISNRISLMSIKNRLYLRILFLMISFLLFSLFLIYRSNWYGLFPYHFN